MSALNPKTYIALTVDVDPDVNLPVKGQTYALSHPLENEEVRIQSCGQGLVAIFKMLAGLRINATFFYEARTADRLQSEIGLKLQGMMYDHEVGCHSYMHEDFLGKESGVKMDLEQMNDTLDKSMAILQDIFGPKIKGFRAPYVRTNDELARVLVDKGFEYDSSVTKTWNTIPSESDPGSNSFQPYFYFKDSADESMNPKALVEVPHPLLILAEDKKMTTYLWPYLEGDLSFNEYESAIEQVCKLEPSNSLLMLGTHPWHLVETYNDGIMNESDQMKVINHIRSILTTLKSRPDVEFVTISEYLDVWHSIQTKTDLMSELAKA
jgi:hypothetical protein